MTYTKKIKTTSINSINFFSNDKILNIATNNNDKNTIIKENTKLNDNKKK